jgi:hypothetical protein
MGIFDSSRTRVQPVFEELLALEDPTWIRGLLQLPERRGASTTRLVGTELIHAAFDERLPAPLAALTWLVRNPARLTIPSSAARTASETQAKRRSLLAGDQAARDEALALLQRRRRGWHVLEGPSSPDLVLETEDAIIVIEGKRTEPGATTETSWWPGRLQMLRHLDAAWELRDGRRIYGFFVVEADRAGNVPEDWQHACEATVSSQALLDSLPHRSPDDRMAIAEAFLGATTWQRIAQTFGLRTLGGSAQPFRFERYDAQELHACARAFRVDVGSIWSLNESEGWTELVLDWFAATAPTGVLVNARQQRDSRRLAKRRWRHIDMRGSAGEWMLDLTHSTYPTGSPADYWRLALCEDRPLIVRLALECEWGRFGDETTTRNAILDDASKIAAVRADVKVMVTGAAPAWAAHVEHDLRRLRAATQDPAPWLWANVADAKSAEECRFEVFAEPMAGGA